MKSVKSIVQNCINTMKNPERHSPFGRLPIEIKAKIFKKLSFKEKKKLRLVCPNWCRIIDAELKFNVTVNNSTLPWIQNCSYKLESLTMENLTDVLTGLKAILPHVRNFIVGKGNSSQNVLKSLCYFYTRATCLTLQNLSLAQISCLSLSRISARMRWDYLASLSIAMGTNNMLATHIPDELKHIDAVISILKTIYLQKLKTFSLNFNYPKKLKSGGMGNKVKKPVLDILSFLLKHAKSLKQFNLTTLGKPTPGDKILHSDTMFELRQLNLETLSVKFDGVNTPFAAMICLNVNKVKTLKLFQTYWMDGLDGATDMQLTLPYILRKHGPTLETLEIRTVSFPFLSLEHLRKLKTFELYTCLPNNVGSPLIPPVETLTKFTAYLFNEYFSKLEDQLIHTIANHFPNTEELNTILMGSIHEFTKEHLEYLLRMNKLKVLKIGRKVSSGFKEFFNRMVHEGAIRSIGRERGIVQGSSEEYEFYRLIINKESLPKYLRQINDGRQTR